MLRLCNAARIVLSVRSLQSAVIFKIVLNFFEKFIYKYFAHLNVLQIISYEIEQSYLKNLSNCLLKNMFYLSYDEGVGGAVGRYVCAVGSLGFCSVFQILW